MENNNSQQISIMDMFKIGVGPSSSHTMGPWKAALKFLAELERLSLYPDAEKVKIHLYGSLALTGKGHGTDKALMLGLSGFDPIDIPMEEVQNTVQVIEETHFLSLNQKKKISFDPNECIEFIYQKSLDFHPNGMEIEALNENDSSLLKRTYFSVGGGFVITENEEEIIPKVPFPYQIETAKDLKKYYNQTNLNIASIVYANELVLRSKEELDRDILRLWEVMSETVFRGCHTSGTLPGILKVSRRASDLHKRLIGDGSYQSKEEWLDHLKGLNPSFDKIIKLVSCFAIATNEENANFGRVVTAPTNGAAGVIPAVLLYFICFNDRVKVGEREIINFLCVASEIGSLFKKKATISAAMGGCQAEIGVSSAMAAAALTSGFGGTFDQVLMAAEIAMEHHLGLTCDPVKGLVQIPCIERNSMGAIKAITASEIALESNPDLAKVSLDDVIKTMWDTACDMDVRYKETSQAGLAANISVSIPEC